MPVLLDLDRMCPVIDEQFKISVTQVNGEEILFNYSKSVVEFESDGELFVKLMVDDEDLLGIVKVESIISYMEDLGYKVI